MAKEVINFYSNLIGTVDPSVKAIDPSFTKTILNFNLSYEASSSLVKEIIVEEIKDAIFDQENEKAPGPDSYSPIFFKKAWNIVGKDVIVAVNHFFSNVALIPAFNSTVVALAPKIPNPSSVKDFEPISCCSVIYKSISKILVKRLTEVLPDIISLNQTAFIRGRNIVDNTLLA
ncbi:uncharacterized protein LOC120166553 [Hibiscus syriacus]|uniref:uncharacterized protein LOC120166553 n=1 Tax=Hibiscus syriacus TaxID=106335 RepID=UPI0019217D4C|nr:uncharacterized protein LOC120166553 [Hibiscus syriacus]